MAPLIGNQHNQPNDNYSFPNEMITIIMIAIIIIILLMKIAVKMVKNILIKLQFTGNLSTSNY